MSSVRWDLMSTFCSFLENFPFFIRNKSSRSFTRKWRSAAEFIIIYRYLEPAVSVTCVSRFFPMPNIAFNGVLISWEMVAVSISRKWFCNFNYSYLIIWVILLAMIILCGLFWKRICCCLNVTISSSTSSIPPPAPFYLYLSFKSDLFGEIFNLFGLSDIRA